MQIALHEHYVQLYKKMLNGLKPAVEIIAAADRYFSKWTDG